MKEIIIGAGEIGQALAKILGEHVDVIDIQPDITHMPPYDYMHICFPYSKDFIYYCLDYITTYEPEVVIVHSTVLPGTIKLLQSHIKVPIVFSPIRGVHKRMVEDLHYYTKYIASSNLDALIKVRERFKQAGMKTETMGLKELEYAKILCDTSYYHVLIAYRQWTHTLCEKEKMNDEDMWRFAGEIHKKLNNRPTMFFDSKGIGGHCVMQNTLLLNTKLKDELFDWLIKMNKKIKNDK